VPPDADQAATIVPTRSARNAGPGPGVSAAPGRVPPHVIPARTISVGYDR